MEDLLIGYQGDDRDQFADLLKRLLPCLDLKNVYFCGGIAIRFHLALHKKQISDRPLRDLDLCATSLDAVLPHIKGKFDIDELQHLQGVHSFFLKLIDPDQSIKIDVFDNTFPAREPFSAKFENYTVKLRNAEDQLVKTVFDMQEVISGGQIDTAPKQFKDARLLWHIIDQPIAKAYWQEYVEKHPLFKGMPKDLEEAMVRAEKFVEEHPDVFKTSN